MTIDEALRTIIEVSPAAAGEALSCIRAARAGFPAVNRRFGRVAELAFSDPDAQFTGEQRAAIAALIDTGDGAENRAVTFRMRLTAAERDAIQAQAEAAGLSMSEWARQRLFAPAARWPEAVDEG